MEIDKAIEQYNEFAKYIDPKDVILQAYVDQQIVSCGNALVGTASPVEYKVGNLGQLQETHTIQVQHGGIRVTCRPWPSWERTPSTMAFTWQSKMAMSGEGP